MARRAETDVSICCVKVIFAQLVLRVGSARGQPNHQSIYRAPRRKAEFGTEGGRTFRSEYAGRPNIYRSGSRNLDLRTIVDIDSGVHPVSARISRDAGLSAGGHCTCNNKRQDGQALPESPSKEKGRG